ncbi:hypothetical protein HanRHA438_Chr13g0628531 [Helianthus annuus]|nr:hypothetical protein HanRHA438_Chr13g0628461 [Helianthus annuus]KAJ0860895.1 hypothetical protein HanRHA438_Chr13g0628531 [Helianthus annuus]
MQTVEEHLDLQEIKVIIKPYLYKSRNCCLIDAVAAVVVVHRRWWFCDGADLQGQTRFRLCGESEEDSNHLFTSCSTAEILWQKISAWCSIPQVYAYNVRDLLQVYKTLKVSGNKRKMVRLIILAACWMVWKARNELIFVGKRTHVDSIFGEVQAMTFLWINHRSKQGVSSWENWVTFSVG